MLPERISRLDVSIGSRHGAGQLLKTSNYEFRYVDPGVAVLNPWQD